MITIKPQFFLPVIFLLFSTYSLAQKANQYPVPPKDSTADTYFNTEVKDPYQWMENPEDPRLNEWLDEQKKIITKQERKQVKKDVLHMQIARMYDGIDRKEIKENITKVYKDLSKYEFKEDYVTDTRLPDLTYRLRGTKRYKRLVRMKDFQHKKDDNPSCNSFSVSEELDIVAVGIAYGGSDWREVHFYNLTTGEKLKDTLNHLRISSHIVWNGNGCYYDSYAPSVEGRESLDNAKGQTLYYHKLGSTQEVDVPLYVNPDSSGGNSFSFSKSKEGRLIFYHHIYAGDKTYNAVSYASLTEGESLTLNNFILYPNADNNEMELIAEFGNSLLFKSNHNAPNGKVVLANINALNQLTQIAPEFDIPLKEVHPLGKNKISCEYHNHGQSSVVIFDHSGNMLKKLDFPEGKKVNGFWENDTTVNYTTFYISSFYHPSLQYQLSLTDFTYKPIVSMNVPYDANELETRYVQYESKDGTQVPMYITCLKSIEKDGKNPTLLYGYGGYGTTVEPRFNKSQTLWLLHGGILAVPNIRGGGAGGSDWSLAGRRLNKQTCIDDFIAAAEFLIEENYTNSEKLAISGGSHGGLLVGASITQRPELFKAAIADAGAFDMLRFENFTVGGANTNLKEFGTVKNQEDFENLKTYSPVHSVEEGVSYPNVLLITGDKDDRVPPLHSYKFLATLQEKGDPKSLYQLYTIPGAGHGKAMTRETFTDKLLYEYYFLFDELGLKYW